jgi:hypothetical protein
LLAENMSRDLHRFDKNNKVGEVGLRTEVVVCPNGECREYTIWAALHKVQYDGSSYRNVGAPLFIWQLKPQSSAKPFPSYIPAPILEDYSEACLVADLSPKAAATLARRCLQGIIRDFWKISKARLIDEINALKGQIDDTTWQAIDAVRSLGNIGAHMEKDINLIVEVDPEEASLLLRLIEVLLEEWYIRRHERDQHMQKVIAAAAAKKPKPAA